MAISHKQPSLLTFSLLCLFFVTLTPFNKPSILPTFFVHAYSDDGSEPSVLPPPLKERSCNETDIKWRSFDGTCNNLKHTLWGARNRPFLRGNIPAKFASNSTNKPWSTIDVRMISNLLSDDGMNVSFTGSPIGDETVSKYRHSMFEIFFGQFVNHDLELDALDFSSNSWMVADITQDPVFANTTNNIFNMNMLPYLPMTPPLGLTVDHHFTPINLGNSYLDLSTIYGSNSTGDAAVLRTFNSGLLITQEYVGNGGAYNTFITDKKLENLPPSAFSTGIRASLTPPAIDNLSAMVSGDPRCSENIQLCIIHTIWIREHNYWAVKFGALHPEWDDEEIYQHARRWVIAEYQHIVFEEYLPVVLGFKMPKYRGYDKNVNVDTSIHFSAAAFRYGHSNIRPFDVLDGCNGQPIVVHPTYTFNQSHPNRLFFVGKALPISLPAYSQLEPGFLDYSPQRILALAGGTQDGNGLDNLVVSMLRQPTAEFDLLITSALRSAPGATDLFAIDIARGRSVGLPDYNTYRSIFHPLGDLYRRRECDPSKKVEDLACFLLINKDHNIATNLRNIYKKVSRIDAIVGMFAEERRPNFPLPPTIANIIKLEFEKKRSGDRFWYEGPWFGPVERKDLSKTRMRDIIERTTGVKNVQQNAFKTPSGNDMMADTECSAPSPAVDNTTTQQAPSPVQKRSRLSFKKAHDHSQHDL